MNKIWTYFIGIAIISVVIVIAYQMFTSASGGNVTFTSTVIPISSDLGIQKMQSFKPLTDFQIIRDQALNPTATPVPTATP